MDTDVCSYTQDLVGSFLVTCAAYLTCIAWIYKDDCSPSTFCLGFDHLCKTSPPSILDRFVEPALSCGSIREVFAALILRSEEHTSELQSQSNLVCRLLLEKKKKIVQSTISGLSALCHGIRQRNASIIRYRFDQLVHTLDIAVAVRQCHCRFALARHRHHY